MKPIVLVLVGILIAGFHRNIYFQGGFIIAIAAEMTVPFMLAVRNG